MKVLIVEDEIRIREGISQLLRRLKPEYQIVGEAENGAEGLQMCRQENPDIIIMDVRMPQMDGLQMLTAIVQEGLRAKAIVISAYSEFEYARQAMKLGVKEYILKPISLNDFLQAIANVEQQIEKDRQKKPLQIGTLEQIFREMVSGRMEATQEVTDYLKTNYNITTDQSFIMLCVYLGNQYEDELEQEKKQLKHRFSMYSGIEYCILDSAYRKSIIMIFYHFKDAHDLERWTQQQVLHYSQRHHAIGWVMVKGIEKLNQGMNDLYPHMDWNISFDKDIMILYPKIMNIQVAPCIYPIEIESRMKVAICASDKDKVLKIANDFHNWFDDGKVYQPKEIKECYIRFLWAIFALAKEIHSIDDDKIKQQELLEQIMHSKMREELRAAFDFVIEQLQFEAEEDAVTHLSIKRVKGMIHEFYSTGITLEEIAAKLHVTPEYLGTQFHQEMGITFSAYLREYRINKAKELLCGTDLKLYEIAERTGYTDSKYFSKVFRKVTGQQPAEYRKTYK